MGGILFYLEVHGSLGIFDLFKTFINPPFSHAAWVQAKKQGGGTLKTQEV